MKKKILLIRNAYSFDFGGAERFPVSLALELKKLDFDSVVASRSKALLNYAEKNNVSTLKVMWWSKQNWSGKNTVLFPVYVLWQIVMIIHYFLIIIYYKINIVHPQSRDDFISATLAAKLLGKKVVWTDHADLKYVWQNHKTWYKNPVGKLVYVCSKLADNITLVSNSEKRLIEKNLGKSLPSKYKIIYNGVEDNEILPIEIDKLDEDSVIFSATSRMVTAKGIGELIEAFILLDKKYSVGLWLLGEGPEISKFKKMSESCKNIKFLGFPENALSYVAASDIFVHPSYHEGFSISLLEAAKLGMPTIACDVGGNSEIIDNGISGTLVKEKNNTELLAAMELLVNNHSLRKKYGDNLRKRYLKDFVFEDIVKRDFVRLYEK